MELDDFRMTAQPEAPKLVLVPNEQELRLLMIRIVLLKDNTKLLKEELF